MLNGKKKQWGRRLESVQVRIAYSGLLNLHTLKTWLRRVGGNVLSGPGRTKSLWVGQRGMRVPQSTTIALFYSCHLSTIAAWLLFVQLRCRHAVLLYTALHSPDQKRPQPLRVLIYHAPCHVDLQRVPRITFIFTCT